MMQTYVTYDLNTGRLTGAFIQEPPDDHLDCMIEVEPEVHAAWTGYRANEARDGVELIPAPGQPSEPPAEAEIVVAYMAAVQQHMDARAVSFGYDNLISVITYAEEPAVPRYQAEGQAFRAWRSACWLACEQMLAAVKSGERSAPTHAELIAELPELGIEHSGPFAPAT